MQKAHPFLILFALFAVTWSAVAQSPAECTALVESAIIAMQDNCDNLDRNSACYGYDAVSAIFTQDVAPDYFTRPADRAGLLNLLTLQTTPLDLDNDRWGIAVINMQANLPNTLPGQAVTLLLVGDSTVENRVSPLDVTPIAPPVTIILQRESIGRTAPSENSNSIGDNIPTGTSLEADALNADGTWLRVVVDDLPAWVNRADTNSPSELNTLPVIASTIQAPMQAFYFTTGIGAVGCAEAPNTITVRSPQNTTVDLNINGIDVRIGSTITLRNTAPNQIAFTVQEGHLETATGEYIEEGNTLIAQTDILGQIVRWEEIRPATSEEVELGTVAERILTPDALRTPSPTREPTTAPETRPPTGEMPGEVIHIVVAGETLFRIATNYDASMPAIVARNNISDPRSIFVGQRLIIPNPGSGFVGLDMPSTPLEPRPTDITGGGIGAIDCSTFAPTSPLNGMLYGENTFRWTAAGGATSYRVIVTNISENRSVAFDAPAPLLAVTGMVDQGTAGGGFDFAWRVQAFQNATLICDSGDRVMQRSAPRVLFVTWACEGSGAIVVTYSGVSPNDTITASFYDPNIASFREQRGTGQTGTIKFDNATMGYTGTATTSSGEHVILSPDPLICP